jgi:hypothetical protein
MVKKKCFICKKKIKSIIPSECKCKLIFCRLHIHPDEHNCTFDYKEEYKKRLIQNNPQIIQEKFVKL